MGSQFSKKCLDDLYKNLSKCDTYILKKFNDDDISDDQYFLYGILEDIISNSMHILTNNFIDSYHSIGVDNSCRTIIEGFTILEMNKKGLIDNLQKRIYRYSYSLVDLENYKDIIGENTQEEILKRLLDDADKCKKTIIERYGCDADFLNKKNLYLGDPVLYLRKKLKEKVKFNEIINQYNKKYLKNYELFSILSHPHCELQMKVYAAIIKIRDASIDVLLNDVSKLIKEYNLDNFDGEEKDFYTVFWNNPVLDNNKCQIKDVDYLFDSLEYKLCFFEKGTDWYSFLFFEKVKNILKDTLISSTLGYLEQVVVAFKCFIELFAIHYKINSVEDLKEFNVLKTGYWLSSRLQIINYLDENGLNIDYGDIELLYNSYYKSKYNLNSIEEFKENIKKNSLYFLDKEMKNYTKWVNYMFEKLTNENQNIYKMLYKISLDISHASGYNFNSSVGVIEVNGLIMVSCMLELLINMCMNAVLVYKDENIDVEITTELSYLDNLRIIYIDKYKELMKDYRQNINNNS